MNVTRNAIFFAGLLLLCAPSWTGCSGSRTPRTDTTYTTEKLVGALRIRGVNLRSAGLARQPFFSESGRAFTAPGRGTLQIYEYDTEEGAARDVGRIDAAQMGVAMPPAVYRRGRLLALYFGDDPPTMSALSEALGLRVP